MCLAIPAQIEQLDSTTDQATVCVGGVKKNISLALVENVQEGDFVLIHVGFALQKISVEEAEKTLALFAEAGVTEAQESMGEPQ